MADENTTPEETTPAPAPEPTPAPTPTPTPEPTPETPSTPVEPASTPESSRTSGGDTTLDTKLQGPDSVGGNSTIQNSESVATDQSQHDSHDSINNGTIQSSTAIAQDFSDHSVNDSYNTTNTTNNTTNTTEVHNHYETETRIIYEKNPETGQVEQKAVPVEPQDPTQNPEQNQPKPEDKQPPVQQVEQAQAVGTPYVAKVPTPKAPPVAGHATPHVPTIEDHMDPIQPERPNQPEKAPGCCEQVNKIMEILKLIVSKLENLEHRVDVLEAKQLEDRSQIRSLTAQVDKQSAKDYADGKETPKQQGETDAHYEDRQSNTDYLKESAPGKEPSVPDTNNKGLGDFLSGIKDNSEKKADIDASASNSSYVLANQVQNDPQMGA